MRGSGRKLSVVSCDMWLIGPHDGLEDDRARCAGLSFPTSFWMRSPPCRSKKSSLSPRDIEGSNLFQPI